MSQATVLVTAFIKRVAIVDVIAETIVSVGSAKAAYITGLPFAVGGGYAE